MLGEDLIAYGIVLVVFLVSLFGCFMLAKSRLKGALVAVGLVWLGFTVAMFFGMHNSSGWDGLGYLLALIGLSAPSGLGAVLGALTGWLKKKDIEYVEAADGARDTY